MYSLTTPLLAVTGVGPILGKHLAARGLNSVLDLLLFVPLRYEDRSKFVTIRELQPNELVTLAAEAVSTNNYYKGRRSIQSAKVKDATGSLKLMWFNNRFVLDKLKVGETYLFSGKLNDRGLMVQPTVEDVKVDTIHTGRLVPLYSSISGVKAGTLRRLLKHVLEKLRPPEDTLTSLTSKKMTFLSLPETFQHLHFPDTPELTTQARERLALEELLGLMLHSNQIKTQWAHEHTAASLTLSTPEIPRSVPFTLTGAQDTALQQILHDLTRSLPMNRLLLGDVGSGKTVVAGIAAHHTLQNKHHAVLVAPTQILAEQHFQTVTKILPQVALKLVTAKEKLTEMPTLPTLFVGTQALLTQFSRIQPALVIFDEQHRFGVAQRSSMAELPRQPHLLTMTATPIPRSLMLTIFSHLQISVIDELPAGRLPVKTWLVPEGKRTDSYHWIAQELNRNHAQALIVCPFIDPSNSLAFENVAAATETFENVQKAFPDHQVSLLHGKLNKQEKAEVIQRLYQREIEVLVTTPIVEVGVDLPAASIIVIEASERFGLASLHQLRGRVGRAGQQAYCLLFTSGKDPSSRERLKKFTEITRGAEVAELDLAHRGAGNLFGIEQHGFDQLKFASWTNLELITQARQVFEQVSHDASWRPLLAVQTSTEKAAPAAN